VPLHSQYLQDATDKVIYKDLNGEELWTMEGLQIPMYHSEDGRLSSLLSFVDSAPFSFRLGLQAHAGSLTCSICDQIFTKPLHWPKATDLPEGMTG
jgi:fatty acid synthase subunit alpha